MVFRIGCFLVGGETAEMVPMWHVLPGDPQDRALAMITCQSMLTCTIVDLNHHNVS